MWLATIFVALDHSWRYVEGPDAIAPPDMILTEAGRSLEENEPSKLKIDNSEHYVHNPAYDTWAIETRNARHRIFLALSDEVKEELLPYLQSLAAEVMIYL